MKTLALALTTLIVAAPLTAQEPAPAAPRPSAQMRQQMVQRERPDMPTLTAEQRTQLRAAQDRHRDALRAIDDQRRAAQRTLEDATRRIVGDDQFRMMQRRMARGGDQRQTRGGQRPSVAGQRATPAAPVAPRGPARPSMPRR